MLSSSSTPSSSKQRRWQDDWMLYARIARSMFYALQAHAADARARGTADAWRTFIGSEAVDWLLEKEYVATRDEGVQLGKMLVGDGLIIHIGEIRGFEDDRIPYILLAQTPSDIVDRIGLLHSRVRPSQYQPPVPTMDASEIQPADVVQRVNSAESVLAISEASVEINENQMLDGDWGDNTKPSDGLFCAPVEAEPGALRLDDGLHNYEFEEPDIKYKQLSYMTFDKNGSDPARNGSRGASSAGASTAVDSTLDMTAHRSGKTFSNLPAFRKKLAVAVTSREAENKIGGSQRVVKAACELSEDQPTMVFTNLPAFREKLSKALSSQVSEPQHEIVSRYDADVDIEPGYNADMEPEYEAEIDYDCDFEIEPIEAATIVHGIEPESMTADRARSVGSGWWGPKSGLRARAWPLFARTSRLFRRRNSSKSESGMSR